MANNIPPEVLIPLVEQRSVIWDKTSDDYKDKDLKTAAWREICCVFDPNFDTSDENERRDLATKITTKWVHIRDAFMRSLKKEKEMRGGTKIAKPYVYKNLLSFLLKLQEPHTHDSYTINYVSCEELYSSSDSDQLSLQKKPRLKTILENNIRQMPQLDTSNRTLDSLDSNQEHPQVSFIKGVLPSLATFDDDEILEFQMGVLALIQNIKRKRRESK